MNKFFNYTDVKELIPKKTITAKANEACIVLGREANNLSILKYTNFD